MAVSVWRQIWAIQWVWLKSQPHRAGAAWTQTTLFSESLPGLHHWTKQTCTYLWLHTHNSAKSDKKYTRSAHVSMFSFKKEKIFHLTVLNSARLSVILKLIWLDIFCEKSLPALLLFFYQKNTGTADMFLIPTKHLCHMINLSQSLLYYKKNTNSSLLISVTCAVFLLHWQRLH